MTFHNSSVFCLLFSSDEASDGNSEFKKCVSRTDVNKIFYGAEKENQFLQQKLVF